METETMWGIVTAVSGTFFPLAFTVLSMKLYVLARIFFIVSAAGLLFADIHWITHLSSKGDESLWKWLAAVSVALLIGTILFRCLPLVSQTKNEDAKSVKKTSNGVPEPPEPYQAHQYLHLVDQTQFVGRTHQLKLLTRWCSPRWMSWIMKLPRGSVTQQSLSDIQVFVIMAIGGAGKSALAWTWFNQWPNRTYCHSGFTRRFSARLEHFLWRFVHRRTLGRFEGRMWYDFYSDASFENFLTRAIAYVLGGRKILEVESELKQNESDRLERLFRELQNRPFLLVLDGFERLLIQYNREDAANLPDDDAAESSTDSNVVVHRPNESYSELVRKFLAYSIKPGKSRILITSRLFPEELQASENRYALNSDCYPLEGLAKEDAYELWKNMGARGGRDLVQEHLARFANHALLVKTLAGEVSNSSAHGDFERWLADNPDFNASHLMRHSKSEHHVLYYSFKTLTPGKKRILELITSFLSPINFDTAKSLLMAPPGIHEEGTYESENELHQDAKDLRDRGLLGWQGYLEPDKNLELHPVIREYLWANHNKEMILLQGPVAQYSLTRLEKLKETAELLNKATLQVKSHFEAALKAAEEEAIQAGIVEPKRAAEESEKVLQTRQDVFKKDAEFEAVKQESLRWGMERFCALVRLGNWQDAYDAFHKEHLPPDNLSLDDRMYYAVGKGWNLRRLLRPWTGAAVADSDTLRQWQKANPREHTLMTRSYARVTMFSGYTADAATFFETAYELVQAIPPGQNFKPLPFKFVQNDVTLTTPSQVALVILSECIHAHRLSGHLREAEWSARKVLELGRELGTDQEKEDAKAINLYRLGMVLSMRGELFETENVFRRSLAHWEPNPNTAHLTGFLYVCLAQHAVWKQELKIADECMAKASSYFAAQQRDNNTMTERRLLGTIAMELGNTREADKFLNKALDLARSRERVEEELLTLAPLAKLRFLQGNIFEAREALSYMEELAMHKSYPCFYADAYNVLATIEQAEHNRDAAVAAATKAYEMAWCDGPPFAYHWALKNSTQNLQALSAALPTMSPFDESKFIPMPSGAA